MKMLHVTIQTEKFEAEVQFYLNIVGLKMITDMRPMGMQMVFLADNEGDTEIEIIENPEAKPIETEFLSIGFKTDNIEKKYDEFKSLGLWSIRNDKSKSECKIFLCKRSCWCFSAIYVDNSDLWG